MASSSEGRPCSIAIILSMALLLAGSLPVSAQGLAPAKPIAEVNGQAITEEEIDKAIAGPLGKLQEQIYTLGRQRLEAAIRERLLAEEAKARGVSVQQLLDAEVTSKVALVTEDEIEHYYQANKARGKGSEDEAREQIRSLLQNQKLGAQREAFLRALRAKASVAIHLEAPPVTRVKVAVNGAPAKGPATAPVTIVEFSDFHCPFCKRVVPTLKEIEAKYGDRVRVVFRDFPIDQLHPGARKAHEAARCVFEQGKFWAYHDLVFDQAPRTTADDLRALARQVGADVARFDQCLASGQSKDVVQKDIDEGARLGVNGTPAFFINGRLVSGAQPLEAFVSLIEDELSRAR
jgi:protein-disulfide isomerase